MADAPRSSETAQVALLAQDLAAAHYSHDAVTQLLGQTAMDALMREQFVPARRVLARLEQSNPLVPLIRAFLLGQSLPVSAWELALPTLGVEAATGLGLLEPDPNRPELLRAAIDLRPHAADTGVELWVASDVGAVFRPGVLRHDHVLGIGRASLTLAASTIRREASRGLDLGVGCGIQTFHLLDHCEHVTATDLSTRALAFTRFNLILNAAALGLDPEHLDRRVTLLQGSLLEPVAGQEFDLVVSNPPFVITPRTGESEQERFTYRDGGMAGDRLVAQLISELPSILAPGGTAQLLANWEVPSRLMLDDAVATDPVTATLVPGWAGPVAAWVPEGTECWVIQRDMEDACGYAETWLRDASEARDQTLYEARYADYLDDFESRDTGGIGLGLIWLRRPETNADGALLGGVGRRFEAIEHAVQQPLGPALSQAIFRADGLARVDVGLVHAVVPADTTMETHSVPGEEHPRAILLRQGAGLRRVKALDTALAGLVSACDGELNLRSLATAVTALLQSEAMDQEQEARAENAEELLARAADLIRDGFLDFRPVRG